MQYRKVVVNNRCQIQEHEFALTSRKKSSGLALMIFPCRVNYGPYGRAWLKWDIWFFLTTDFLNCWLTRVEHNGYNQFKNICEWITILFLFNVTDLFKTFANYKTQSCYEKKKMFLFIVKYLQSRALSNGLIMPNWASYLLSQGEKRPLYLILPYLYFYLSLPHCWVNI